MRSPKMTMLALLLGCEPQPFDETATLEGAEQNACAETRPEAKRIRPRVTWHWQLEDRVDHSVRAEVYDVDLFDVSASEIRRLHREGRTVICYFSAGSREDWRLDASEFRRSDYMWRGDGWDGERWLNTRSPNVRRIMRERLDLAVSKKCDGVEPDNVDGYTNGTGFDLEREDQLDYNLFLSAEARVRGLSVGLKNAPGLVWDLEPYFDWALAEECVEYDECHKYRRFLDEGKAVLHAEYGDTRSEARQKRSTVCRDQSRRGFSTLIKTYAVDAWFERCED